ncbi:MAG: sugar ABC transporter ATP-binding protein [Candidatus Solibacter sp.]
MPLLEAKAIAKSFAGVQALRGVSLELRTGEVHALLGENGAGKSTLIKIITGAETADSGDLLLNGIPLRHNSPAAARALGIAAVYQQPALFPDLTVEENIAIALEDAAIWRRIDWRARRQHARDLLDRCGAALDPGRTVSTLSMPEQQLVEIAKAIGARAKVVIFDEPTASLTEREVERLFRVIEGLRQQGAGIIYISHRLEEVSRIATRATVLRDGQIIATCGVKEVDRAELVRLMVGRDVHAIFPKREVPLGDVALEVRGLGCRAAGIRGIDLTVRRGEILGIAGLVGSGRTQLAETLFGLTPADEGEIRVRGEIVRMDSPAAAIGCKLAYLPEDRRQHGVVLEMPVAANTTLACLAAITRHGLIDAARERSIAKDLVERLRIKTPSIFTEAGALSGGNQQKVAVARWLAIAPEVMILDEPTQGVDIGSKSEIHQIMMDLAARGMAIVMISSELPEILGMSDRIAVMHGGKIAGVLSRAEATQERVLALALGHN